MKSRFTKRAVSAALTATMVIMLLLPMAVPAATRDYQFKTLKAGTWATESYKYNEKTGIDYTYYKITVSKPGRLNFTLSGSYASIDLYTVASDIVTGNSKGSSKYLSTTSESKLVAVEKGTYYMYVNYGKCKYTFTSSAAATNYCPAKARALKANTTVYNVFTPRTNFARWFRISNPKKKKIIVRSNRSEYAYNMSIYNSKLQSLRTIEYGSDLKYCTKTAVPKGTYYIRVECQYPSRYDDHYDYAFGDVATVRWQ